MMQRSTPWMLVLLLAVALAAPGCKNKDGGEGGDKGDDLGALEGELSSERLLAARDMVKPFDPWDKAFAKLTKALGEPTKVEEGMHKWAVGDKETCTYFEVEKDGDKVGIVQHPMKTTRAEGPVMNFSDCLKIIGVTKLEPEDPNAPAPPDDGSSVTVEDFTKNAVAGRSKWKGQKVTVGGVFLSATTSTSGDERNTIVSISADKQDTENTLRCQLGDVDAPSIVQYTPVTVTGTVTIDEMVSMDGDARLVPGLDDCTVAAQEGEDGAGDDEAQGDEADSDDEADE